MAQDWGTDDPVVSAPAQSWGMDDAVVGESPYSPAVMAELVQALVQSKAKRKAAREEEAAKAAAPRIGIGLRAPFGGEEIGRVDLPEEAAAFISEAIKSSPATAAGIAAASGATPLANRLAAPVSAIPVLPTAIRLGVPLVAGGTASISTRLAQDKALPQILPESLERAYDVSSELAARNPNAALLGQVAGSAPFFRPGLPVGTEGVERLTVPLITGGIGAGIEGANQIADGDFDPQRLALAAGTAALMNRETRLGARIGPNLVLPNAATRATPAELEAMRLQPADLSGAMPSNMELPAELAAVGAARNQAAAELEAPRLAGEKYVQRVQEGISADKVRALAERMAGKTPTDQLAILEQEMALQGKTLSEAEQRAGLDLKIELKRQIAAQKAMEQAAKAEQKATADAQAAAAEAAKPPEVPKSTQILQQSAKPPALANVATEIATQTKQSPYALQNNLNKMTGVETAPAPTVAPAEFVGIQEGIPGKIADIELYNLTADIPGHPTGSTVSRETLEKAGYRVPEQTKGEQSNAIQKPSPREILQREPSQAGEAGGQRGRVEQGQQGAEAPGNRAREEAGGESKALRGLIDKLDGEEIYTGRDLRDDIDAMYERGEMPEPIREAMDNYDRARKEDYEEFGARSGLEGEGEEAFIAAVKRFAGEPRNEPIKKPKKNNVTVDVSPILNAKTELESVKIGGEMMRQAESREDMAAIQKAMQKWKPPEARPQSAELRLNNADLGMRPLSEMKAAEKLAELKANGIKTYKGKPIEDANPAQLSNALGKLRRGQLEKGGINPSLLSGGAGSVLGGAVGYFSTDDQMEGESDEAYKARLLQNTLAGAAIGGSVGIGAMSRAARASIDSGPMSSERGSVLIPGGEERQRITKPSPEEGQGVRRLAERVVDDTERTVALRQALADNPEIIYDKFLLNDLDEHVRAATPQELAAMRMSNDRNAKAAATIELANRAAAAGDDLASAALYADASTQFTSSAQLLNVAKLVRSPAGFVTAVKESLKEVGRTTTPAQDAEIIRLGRETVKAEQELAKTQRAAEADFSHANQKAYEDAKMRAAKANSALARYVGEVTPKGWDDIIIQTIQGNLLTPLSQVTNVYGNVLFQPVRRGSMAIASGLDAIYSTTTGKPRVIDKTNPLPRKAEMEAFADGVKVAAKELLTGPGTESFAKGEVQRGFRPIRSLVQSITGENLARTESGSIAISDRLKKFTEGTVGIPPEVMFRFLNLGDRGFRRAAEVETLLEQARLRGLKGRDLERFIEFPDKATQKLLNTEARKAIFAQENKGVNKLNAFLDHGLAELIGVDNIPSRRVSETVKSAFKIFGRLNVPFRQFPVNYISTAFNFAVPELAFAQAAIYGRKGNRREMLTNIGEGIMGATMYGAAAYLWKHGLISEPTDKDAKQRSIQYDNMGGQRINLSGLNRALSGGDPTWQRDDKTVDWGRMGIPAPVFYVYTMAQNKGRKELQQTGVAPAEDNSVKGDLIRRVEKFPGMASFALDQSFLAGSAAFLDAMKNGFTGPEGDAWAANMFRAGSTLAVPNTVEALARAEYQYTPELRGDTVGETFKNIWDFKTFQLPKDDRAILKRDIWGEPIARTPPNQNPYVYQFFDVTKSAAKQDDQFKANLAKTFMASDNPNTYPSLPDRSLSLEGTTIKLYPKDYETLQAITGRLRREYSEPLVLDAEFNSIPPQERVAELERIYAQAAKDARDTLINDEAFRQRYGFNEQGTPTERVTRRNTKARSRIEQEEAPASR